MGAHALGAAAYAAKAAALAQDAADDEIAWQLSRLSADTRVALRRLPLLGENSAGPLGPGLMSRGILGSTIRELQAALLVS